MYSIISRVVKPHGNLKPQAFMTQKQKQSTVLDSFCENASKGRKMRTEQNEL